MAYCPVDEGFCLFVLLFSFSLFHLPWFYSKQETHRYFLERHWWFEWRAVSNRVIYLGWGTTLSMLSWGGGSWQRFPSVGLSSTMVGHGPFGSDWHQYWVVGLSHGRLPFLVRWLVKSLTDQSCIGSNITQSIKPPTLMTSKIPFELKLLASWKEKDPD